MTSPYAIGLSHFAPFGSRTYPRLFEALGTYEAIWQASYEQLRSLHISEQTANKFVEYRRQVDLEKLVNNARTLGIDTIDRDDVRYPAALKTIHDPPIILYVRGQVPNTDQMIGIVGSRDATTYGLKIARQFANELSRAGLIVISGLARGIDLEAHAGAMATGGKTIAVIAHGHEHLTGSKREFGEQIIKQGGAVMTEQPPNMRAMDYHFPIRNRIIAGLSRGVLIVEAEIASGTMHTAQAAINAHREVFAIPGQIDSPYSTGTNKLLQDGAHVTMSVNDVLLTLNLPAAKPAEPPVLVPASVPEFEVELTSDQKLILANLSHVPIHVDELCRVTNLSSSIILGTLTILEIHGKVRPLGNMYYSL